MKKITKKATLFICLGILTLLSIALLSNFLWTIPKEKIKYTDFSDCNIGEEEKDCNYLFELENKETILVTLGKETTHIDGKKLQRQYVKLGNTRVWEGYIVSSRIVNMRVWGNLIIAHYTQGYGCGNLEEVVAYNSDIKQIINYGSEESQQNIDDSNPTLGYYDIKINDEKKEIEIGANNYGGCTGGLKVPNIENSYPHYWWIEPCNKIDVEKYKVSPDYVTEARYLIKYQGNENFSKPVQIYKETFKEILENCEEEGYST